MAASPKSTVSSDLYALSEPESSKMPSNGDPPLTGDLQDSCKGSNNEAEGSVYSDTMQGLDSAPEDVSRPSSAQGSLVPGSFSEASHKRKLDEYIEFEDDTANYIPLGHEVEYPQAPRIGTPGSLSEDPHRGQYSGIANDRSIIKRSKLNQRSESTIEGSRTPRDFSALPAALWQRIFCFVPPVFLGRLLRVNRTFNSYLTPGSTPEKNQVYHPSIVQPLEAETIWVASRRLFAPGLPRPIHGKRELDMWRLLIGQNCQICGHTNDTDSVANFDNPWEAGPGQLGVRVIWPFGVRCCGPCLVTISQKEFELYLSTCPSFLVPAIPFAFVSSHNHYVGHNLLKTRTPPSSLQLTKHFHKPGIEYMMRRFEDAKALGAASAEEWSKGLATQGQERLEDIIRWEQWESKGGLRKIKSRHHKPLATGNLNANKRPLAIKDDSHSDRSTPQSLGSLTRHEAGETSGPVNVPNDPIPIVATASDTTAPPGPVQSAWNPATQYSGMTHQALQTPTHCPRPERNIRDVNEAKAIRRAEIERRCAILDPPLTPKILTHMESFQAAIQITQPMTDQAWQILKPRLLAQLPYAERKEKERIQQDELIAEEYRHRRHQEAQLKETKENIDREWETFQNPVRNRLGALADEVIESRWDGGRSLSKEISPKFAADVLLQVRERFYAEIAREDDATAANGEPIKADPPNGPPTRTLILENMKWLYDTKVKPLTDHFQRELFLCNGCDGNFKFYGFEGVIQHYAAKHTIELSMGNIVVHWRAEWPEHPPFNPNPSVAKTAYYKVPNPGGSVQARTAPDIPGSMSNGDYNQTLETDSASLPQQWDNYYQHTGASTTTYGRSHQDRHSIPLPNQSYSSQIPYSGPGAYSGAPNGFPSSTANYNAYSAPPPAQGIQSYGSSHPTQQPLVAFGQGLAASNPQSYTQHTGLNHHNNGPPPPYQPNYQNGTLSMAGQVNPGPVSDLYQRQMDEMAKHAKDVFIGIGGVKDLPGSVRIYVVIHLTVARFKSTFANEPSLSMFIDGLDHNATMRPVRSVNGLGCKTCIQSGTGAKLFTLPHLVNHFRAVHLESSQMQGHTHTPDLDWKTDMIDLPDASIVSRLVNAAGMNESKLGLIASVFRGYFPTPLPNLRGKTNTGPLSRELDRTRRGLNSTPLQVQFRGHPQDQLYGQPYSALRYLSQDPSPEPPGEDEYDPHRPALLRKPTPVGLHPGRIDTSTRPLTLNDSIRPSNPNQSESFQNQSSLGFDLSQSLGNAATSQRQLNGDLTQRVYEPVESLATPHSPESNDLASSRGHVIGPNSGQAVPQLRQIYGAFDEHHLSAEQINGYHHNHNGNTVKPIHYQREIRSASPPEPGHAAEQFLSSLIPRSNATNLRAPPPSDQEAKQRQETPWHGNSQVNIQKEYRGDDGSYVERSGEKPRPTRQDDELDIQQVRTGNSNLRKDIQRGTSQRPASQAHYYEEYRMLSQSQMPLNSLRDDQSPTTSYYPQQIVLQDKEGPNGRTVIRSTSKSRAFQTTHGPPYGPRSGSPHEVPADMALYRPRSPVEEDRGEQAYRARSPFSLRPNDGLGKVVNYDPTRQDRQEYIDDRDVRDGRYQHRVELVRVPIGYEDLRMREPSRYLVSRPVEQVEPQYVRYEPAYGVEHVDPVYERSGQLYHVPQRTLHGQLTRAATQDHQF